MRVCGYEETRDREDPIIENQEDQDHTPHRKLCDELAVPVDDEEVAGQEVGDLSDSVLELFLPLAALLVSV